MKIFVSTFVLIMLFSCQQETEAERINREINESLEKLNRKIEEGNNTVDKKTKKILDQFEKEIGLDSTGKIKINKIEPITFAKKGYLNTGDSVQLKIMIADYDSTKAPVSSIKKKKK